MAGFGADTATTGSYNTAIGQAAGKVLQGDANSNTFVGFAAGDTITTGYDNIGIGRNTLGTATTASYCIAIGNYAGDSISAADTDANGSVFIGYNAGTAVTDGRYNTAVGYRALYTNQDGDKNTAIGWEALYNYEAASGGEGNNTAVGYQAGYHNDTGETNTYIGSQAGFGASGTNSGDGNTLVGHYAGNLIQGAGASNTIVGAYAGDEITTGSDNVVVGTAAMSSADTNESRCVAIGRSALAAMDSDDGGTGSDGNMRTVAIGYNAGATLDTGYDNTIIGYNAGDGTDDGNFNTAVGTSALGANCGNSNTAIGRQAGVIATGNYNTFVGALAGNTTAAADSNICIGYNTECEDATATKQFIIGVSLNGTADEAVFIGDDGDHIRCDWGTDATWDKVSDKRKKNVSGDSPLGLDFINDLNTVQFTFKAPSEYPKEWTSYDKDKTEPRNNEVQHGLLAQDVKQALDNANVDTFSGWSEDPDGCQRIGESAFVYPLMKAVQELSAQVEELKNKLGE